MAKAIELKAGHTTVLTYRAKMGKSEAEITRYLEETIAPQLKDWGVRMGDFWTIKDRNLLLLVALVDYDQDWLDIPGIDEYFDVSPSGNRLRPVKKQVIISVDGESEYRNGGGKKRPGRI
ncbi:MAG: hypothetical protein SF339_06735 [Blastocatellia bacterium]|nr:hypothetical protein [Blastocatellia bacterium]